MNFNKIYLLFQSINIFMINKNHHLQPLRPSSLPQSNALHFRIRSSSKQKFLSTITKSKQKSFYQTDQQKNKHNLFTQKVKLSHKELRKILTNRRHQRQHSQDINRVDGRFLETLDHRKQTELPHIEQHHQSTIDDLKRKIVYDDVKTEESHIHRKNWIDINSIDTAQDIKILDRITTMCDPFRIIKECDLKKKIQRKSEQHRVKSISVKKSKLTDKINTLVFEMAAKSKSKNGFKIHRNKFQPINTVSSKQSQQSSRNQNKQFSPKQNQLRKSTHIQKDSLKTGISKQLQISSQLKQSHLQKTPSLQRAKPSLAHIQTKNKVKINVYPNMKQNNKNDVMQKFWSGINESLILAAQQEYVSKDLNQLLYNNMA